MTQTPQVDPEFKALIPPLAADELAQLRTNIVREGCRDPLATWNGVLLDGHNRLAICTELKIDYTTAPIAGITSRDEAKLWIINNQLGRRNITDFVRGELALAAKPLLAKLAKARQGTRTDLGNIVETFPQGSGKARDAVGKLANLSGKSVEKVEKIVQQGAPELLDAARSGLISINAAVDIAGLDKKDQVEVIAEGKGFILKTAQAIRGRKAKIRKTEQYKNFVSACALSGTYGIIYADPPWRYEHVNTDSRAIENQYPTQSLDEIKNLEPIRHAADDCVLFLWAPPPKLAEALDVIPAWGFTYRTGMVWDKEVIGMGYYFRLQHEHLLIAVRGNPPTPNETDRVSSVYRERRPEEHSAKPDYFRDLIAAMYPEVRKIELYARGTLPEGWDAWGNEANAT